MAADYVLASNEIRFFVAPLEQRQHSIEWPCIPARKGMKFFHQRFFRLAAGAGALTAISLTIPLAAYDARSQAARTTKLVVPFQAGGSADTLARLLADQIGRARGLTFIV